MKKYKIELSESQMMRLENACDLVCRLRCGGFEDLQTILERAWTREHDSHVGTPYWYDTRHFLEDHITKIKKCVWGLSPHANKGIGYDSDADSLFDMRKCMEKARYDAFDETKKEMMRYTTMSDGPLGFDKEGPIVVELVGESE